MKSMCSVTSTATSVAASGTLAQCEYTLKRIMMPLHSVSLPSQLLQYISHMANRKQKIKINLLPILN